ncbi:hypothetical protein EVAR_11396_1 [Eumeta japonica]|uniref:Uncharacterized protein n=1 Tax=Eumeta variegata TaxID=151549 RepID=A0A4C1TNC7_EUMVA|nr:hypothetical protein EVAR_11396_1 [Eumeta japonica]
MTTGILMAYFRARSTNRISYITARIKSIAYFLHPFRAYDHRRPPRLCPFPLSVIETDIDYNLLSLVSPLFENETPFFVGSGPARERCFVVKSSI